MQFMRRFARICDVLYVNSLGVSGPRVGEGAWFARRVLRKARSMARYCRDGGEGFRVVSPVFWPAVQGWSGRVSARLLAVQLRLIARVLGMHRPLLWVACPTAAVVVERLRAGGLVYQLSDCYASLGGKCDGAARLESELARRADLVLCSSTRLLERSRALYAVGEYVDHGVDFDLFDSAARAHQVPEELRDLPRPLIGFFGNLDGNTVDRGLLERVIESRPRYTFVLVGPAAPDFEVLGRHRNVTMIGRRPYRQIAHYGAAFDVCLMPWLQNTWIEHCNPVKLKEYLALGKPIVSTPFPELGRVAHHAYVAVTASEFAAAIDTALAEDGPEKAAGRKDWAAGRTWDAQFERVLQLLSERRIFLDGDAGH